MHTNYQPARKGLTDAKIASEKANAVNKTFANPEGKRVVMTALYGATGPAHEAVHSRVPGVDELIAEYQRSTLKYSDQGDFTRCYRGGF